MHPIFAPLRGGLIVSCQALVHEPLRDPRIMAAMAAAAVAGGAVAIRASGAEDVAAIRRAVAVPILGLTKRQLPDSPIYITPTVDDARAVAAAGADVVIVAATGERRPGGESLAGFLAAVRAAVSQPLLADVSTAAEGREAAALGVDAVATTLAGYTPQSRHAPGPDLTLVAELAAAVAVPVIAEGRIETPEDARRALDAGAFAVVVGSMITRPSVIAARFVAGMRGEPRR